MPDIKNQNIVEYKVEVDNKDAKKSLGEVNTSAQKTGTELKNAVEMGAKAMETLKSKLGALGVAGALALLSKEVIDASKEMYEFEKTITRANGELDRGTKELEKYKKRMIAVSNSIKKNINDVAVAQEGLRKEGYDLAGSLEVLEAGGNLANATFEDLESGVSNVSTVLRAFNLDVSNAEMVSDKLAYSMGQMDISGQQMNDVLTDSASLFAKSGGNMDQFLAIMMKSSREGKKLEKVNQDINATITNGVVPVKDLKEQFEGLATAQGLAKKDGDELTDTFEDNLIILKNNTTETLELAGAYDVLKKAIKTVNSMMEESNKVTRVRMALIESGMSQREAIGQDTSIVKMLDEDVKKIDQFIKLLNAGYTASEALRGAQNKLYKEFDEIIDKPPVTPIPTADVVLKKPGVTTTEKVKTPEEIAKEEQLLRVEQLNTELFEMEKAHLERMGVLRLENQTSEDELTLIQEEYDMQVLEKKQDFYDNEENMLDKAQQNELAMIRAQNDKIKKLNDQKVKEKTKSEKAIDQVNKVANDALISAGAQMVLSQGESLNAMGEMFQQAIAQSLAYNGMELFVDGTKNVLFGTAKQIMGDPSGSALIATGGTEIAQGVAFMAMGSAIAPSSASESGEGGEEATTGGATNDTEQEIEAEQEEREPTVNVSIVGADSVTRGLLNEIDKMARKETGQGIYNNKVKFKK